MVNTILIFITSVIAVKSQCSGCSSSATCDHQFVENAIYGCGGEWGWNGVSNGGYLCNRNVAYKNGYSICESKDVASDLGLTKALCINDTIVPNYLYVTLQSSLDGDKQCTDNGIDDVFGCTNPESSTELVNMSDVINCGPLGAQLSTVGEPWKFGWNPWMSPWTEDNELPALTHGKNQINDPIGSEDWGITDDSVVMGGVMCCKDEFNGDPSSRAFDTSFTAAQLSRIETWKSRSIYQVLTDRFSKTNISDSEDCSDLSMYCGGTFAGIMNNLDYIQGLGYDTIWISPPIANTENGYHGYWAENIYEINSYFGSEAEYLALVDAIHDRDMYIMIDVVANHMGYGYNDVEQNFSMFTPFNDSSDYHDSCDNPLCERCNIHEWNQYSTKNRLGIEECRLSGLPDLNQSKSEVSDLLCEWLKNYVITRWKADAIRVDTVPEIDVLWYADVFLSSDCLSDEIFNIGEYFHGDPALVSDYQPTFDSLLSYPMWYTMRDVFGKGWSMTDIDGRISAYASNFLDYSVLGNFLDNHDNNRWLCDFSDVTNYKNAILFQHTAPGIPIGYYGTEQEFSGCEDPGNREPLWTSGFDTESMMYQYISSINGVRNEYEIYDGRFTVVHSESDIYVYSRGIRVLVVLVNNGQTFTRNITIGSAVAQDTYCNVLVSEQDCFDYNGHGETVIYIENGEGKLYVSNTSATPELSAAPTQTYTTGMPSMATEVSETIAVTEVDGTTATEDDSPSVDGANVIYPIFTVYICAVFIIFWA